MRLQPGVVMPGGVVSVAASGGGARTEAEFNAHIAALAIDGSVAWLNGVAGGACMTTVGAFIGSMFGSSWVEVFDTGSQASRVIQHGLSGVAFASIQAGQQVFFKAEAYGPVEALNSVSRNSYTSQSFYDDGREVLALKLTKLIRWDRALNKAFQSNPSIGSAETEYIF